ncbi:GNAT family N-acetyltransferase [Candidatus Contubernalis alkaliaceticus]|uniref:GNAT family N-acetyltransferase n=1 Tax=Candidatus Contubernalis alkaliaceticus TaxID=338645 RepID=UPI001F4BEFFC|nr:GNAT family N-acetyltransferase [Candidatus Contubernalis alkalaceticus]UNC93589.1 GNAT family N-acetyltransferase [Candidatus Contubernalis alkalaceticus]
MESFEVLEIEDDTRWLEELKQVGTFDIYHLPSYHRLSETAGEGRGVMIIYKNNGLTVLFPLLLRRIQDLPFVKDMGKGFKDAVSVYGYGGPVASRMPVEEEKASFWKCLLDYLNSARVISVFSSLHPLLGQENILRGLGEIMPTSPTISIDLTGTEEAQYSDYRKSHRRRLKGLEKEGCVCFEDREKQYWEEFEEIYLETMERANASRYYFFSKEYFSFLKKEMAQDIHLFVCLKGSTVINAGTASLCNGIVQAHLGGTRKHYLALSPEVLSVDTLRAWGKEKGAHTLHLGRGFGGADDSLLHFKKGFSKRDHSFNFWKCIIRKDIYSQLYGELCRKTGVQPEGAYFPAYRHPAFFEGHPR